MTYQESNIKLKGQLKGFKKKYYKNKMLKGSILFTALVLVSFLLINSLEFTARLGSQGRALLFFGYVGLVIGGFVHFVGRYIWLLNNNKKQITNEEAAIQIGVFFPKISDKLLNIIQLEKLSGAENELLLASILQKSNEIQEIPFTRAIDYKKNRKFLKYALGPGAILVLMFLFLPKFITESSTRILKYNSEFIAETPFTFLLENEKLQGFKGESYTVKIKTEGKSSPESLYVLVNNRKLKAIKTSSNSFEYTFNRIQSDLNFLVEAENIQSENFKLTVVERPSIGLFSINLDFPNYLKRDSETLQNSGNMSIPEGTEVSWQFETARTDHLYLNFKALDIREEVLETRSNNFHHKKSFRQSTPYSIELQNQYSKNKDSLLFNIEIIKDLFPKITFDHYQDTVLFQSLVLGGNITDDYGFSKLNFFFKYQGDQNFQPLELSFNPQLTSQSYYKVYTLDSSKIQAGSEISYYLQVSDNDGVNGRKSTKTGIYSFKIPSKAEIEEEIDAASREVRDKIDETLKSAQELNKKIEEADERLKTKKKLDWQDEKLMQDILKQKEEIQKKLDELNKENKLNNMKQEKFSPQSEALKEKIDQLQKLMNELLDDETKKLYEELKELLENQEDIEEFRQNIEDLKNQEGDLEEEIERALELFKKLQFDQKLEEAIEDLDKEIEDQESLLEETEDRKTDTDDLSEQQEQEKSDMEKLEEKLDELNELNQDRNNPDALPEDLKEDIEDIKKDQESSKEQLQNNKRNQSKKSQQGAVQKMKKIKKSLESMQSSMQSSQQQENIQDLRNLVDNLVTLSFNQEDLMNEFRQIRQSDPRFNELSQEQLKLKDDSKIIQDSLIALSQRVFQISSFVMRELSEMNRQMDGSLDDLKEKNISQATAKQQFTMTSINNLALLLDDVLQQMQEQMAQAMGMGKGKDGNQPQPGSLGELQRQLSQQIGELKRSGKTGRALSEELAKLASQQERLRNALQNFETGADGDKLGDKIDQLAKEMEKNEIDLINKNITNETINRQKEILTRLLDAENAMQERGEEEKRKAKTAFDYELSIPQSLSDYLKAKEKEIELLKTIPAKLNPYYKKETNKYFKKIKQQN